MKDSFIPYNSQFIDKSDIKAVSDTLTSAYLTTGPKTEEFEKALAEYLGVKYVVVCANGTAALLLSMKALDIGPGDCVLTSPVTFIADANAPRFCGADVTFSDVENQTVNIDPQEVRKILKRKKNIKAIIPVHFAGHVANMEELNLIAKEYKVHLIEDGCHALGGGYFKNKKLIKVGNCKNSIMTTFSFHPIKSITTGEGGAITTNNKKIYERLLTLRSHGTEKNPKKLKLKKLGFTKVDKSNIFNPWYYEMQELSQNFRLTDFQSALGVSQLKKIDQFIKKRNELADIYDGLIDRLSSKIIIPLKSKKNVLHARHLYVVRIPMKNIKGGRAKIMTELLKRGIQTQVHYIPIYLQPYYQKYFRKHKKLKESENYYDECLSLPLHVQMNKKDCERVIKNLDEIIIKFWKKIKK
ncbi:UDP-4-amino-4,6-dideoxy-N-acetyl-beta-L-altrosamine transaminase [SAR86 cluster bacterium]|nr:UDP-4-amino-4,6-dideoxy-N-acetyl-beta-L-altrosamine transaminase [SAR86 cluster bacterium]